jgi:hypothetical protein
MILAPGVRADELDEIFANPPDSAKPGVWWHWMGCNVTREGVTRDLEAFKAAGIGGATLFGMADVCTPWAAHIDNSPTDGLLAFTDPWWKLVRHAAEEGRRLGLDVGMHNCPGYTHSGGPWIPPELSMQEVCWTQVTVAAGARFDGVLPRPQVDPRAHMAFPVVNKDTGVLEKPVVEARRTFYRDIAVLALPASGVVAADRVVDLTKRMQADGRLDWTAPAGEWTILRIGHTTMGSMTQPNQWEVRGLECDKMSAEANEFHLRHVLGEMRKHLGDLVGTGLKHVLFDSYEAGRPSWTPRMPQEFAARRGYDLTPFLATFAKRTIGGDAETKKFKADFDRTIADLYRDIHFPIVERRLREAGLRFTCEPYGGPWQTGEVAPHVHRVMTEFWTSPSGFRGGPQSGIFNAGDGKLHNILEAEAFTGGPENSRWTEHPDGLKPVGDGAFCAGINRLVFHGAIHQPWDDRHRPGNSMGRWGTHFGRLQTWWEPGTAWLAHLQRCQALLQWGAVAPRGGVAVEAADPGLRIRSRHRTDGRAHVFFVANAERTAGAARLAFAVAGLQPELWDPVTGTKRDLPAFRCADGTTTLTLEFAPAQSGFVVFRKEVSGVRVRVSGRNLPALKPVAEVAGPWRVDFDPAWGGPAEPVAFAALEDWTKRPEPAIRYFSGTATYRTTFDTRHPTPDTSFLSLGLVHHLARVRLNGRDLGVVWCAPWRVEIPAGLLKATGNELEVEITNVWANRLIGDEQEPPDCEWLPGHMPGGSYLKRFPDWFVKGTPRPSPGRRCFVTWNYFTKDSPLTPSGLMGPVRLMTADWTAPLVEPVGKPAAAAAPAKSGASCAAQEADVPKAGRLPVASVEESGVLHAGGGKNADALFNGTTRNGKDGDATLDDGQTFRGYGDGSVLTIRLDTTRHPQGHRLEEIRTFAGHPDARAGQYYTVSVAKIADPSRFEPVSKITEACPGGASLAKVPVKADGVVAVRFEFRNGPPGFCVYREISLLGPSVPPPPSGTKD